MAILRKLLASSMPWGLANALEADIGNALTATGTSQSDALPIAYGVSRFTTVDASTGAILPANSVGDSVLVINAGANALSVYPPSGHSINSLAADVAYSIPVGGMVALKRVTNTLWLGITGDSAAQVFLQSGTGASATSVQTELRRWIRPEHFGAAADGATNDRTAISNADTAATSSGTILFQAGKTYLCSTSLTIAANCYFEPGAVISSPAGQTITFSNRVIALDTDPVSGGATATYSHDGNFFINASANSGGLAFGSTASSGTDDFVHFQRSVNTSVGILLKNPNTGNAADGFFHIWGGEVDVSGSDIRIAAQSSAMGGEVNIVGKCNSLATNTSAQLNIINASNAGVSVYANNKKQFTILPTSNTVNFGTVKGGASGSSPIWSVGGIDSNLSFIVDAIGTGGFIARTDAGTINAFEVIRSAGASRWITVTPSTTNPTIDVTAGLLTIGSTSVTLNIASGGSTTISTGVGSVKMSTANAATNTAWIPLAYGGTTYYVPAWTTNAP